MGLSDIFDLRKPDPTGDTGVIPMADLAAAVDEDPPAEVIDVDKQLKQLARVVRGARKRVTKDVLAIAAAVATAQELLATAGRDGQFSAWLKTTGTSRATAYRLIDLHKLFGQSPHVRQFDPETLPMLARSPDAAADALEMAAAGEAVTPAVAKNLVRKHKAAPKLSDRPAPIIYEVPGGMVVVRCSDAAGDPEAMLAAAMRQIHAARKAA